MHLNSKSPIYDVLLLAHVICAIGGFGATGLAGFYANQLAPEPSEAAVRYFSTSNFVAERLLYLVPVFGVAMIAVSHGISEFQKPWIITGILLWLAAVGVAHALVWPREREVARLLASNVDPAGIRVVSKKLQAGSVVLDAIFVAALFVMIAQPGGK